MKWNFWVIDSDGDDTEVAYVLSLNDIVLLKFLPDELFKIISIFPLDKLETFVEYLPKSIPIVIILLIIRYLP